MSRITIDLSHGAAVNYVDQASSFGKNKHRKQKLQSAEYSVNVVYSKDRTSKLCTM